MIQTHSLKFQYPQNTTFTYPDVYCKSGERVLVSGASGKGKTTLLHLLAGILSPKAGKIIISGTDLTELSPSRRDAFRAEHMGLVFQKSIFIQGLSVWENLVAARKIARKSTDAQYLRSLCQSLDIETLQHKKNRQLSLGEQQRFSLARALATQPQIVLADEPTSHLDDENCRRFLELWSQAPGAQTQIVVSHDHRIKSYFQKVYTL